MYFYAGSCIILNKFAVRSPLVPFTDTLDWLHWHFGWHSIDTDLNPRWPHVTMHEIYTLITHAELMFISTYYFQIFIYWFISILILLIRSGHIIVSFYYFVSSYIFRAIGYMRSSKFKSLLDTNWRGHRQNKSWSCTYCVTMHQRKIRTKLFPNQDAVQCPTFLLNTEKKFVKEAIVHGLYAPTTMQCLA